MKHYDGMEARGQMAKKTEQTKVETQAAVQTPVKVKDELATGFCCCGCGAPTGNLFCPGHDSRVYSLLRKYNAGVADISTLDHLPAGVADRYIGNPHAQPIEKAEKAPAVDKMSVGCELCDATFVTTVEATEHMATAHAAKEEVAVA